MKTNKSSVDPFDYHVSIVENIRLKNYEFIKLLQIMIIRYSYKYIFIIQMETVKELSNFCNAALFYDYKNLGITDELNQARSFKN